MPIKNVLYLSKTQYQNLLANGSITIGGITYNYNQNDMYCVVESLYRHDIYIEGDDGAVNAYFSVMVLNDDPTEFDEASLIAYLNNLNTPRIQAAGNYNSMGIDSVGLNGTSLAIYVNGNDYTISTVTSISDNVIPL